MQISDTDLQNALLELFASRGLATGDVMWMSRLEAFWVETRLRRSDLLYAIAQLCSQGLLDLEEVEGETHLSLSEAGEKRSVALLGEGADHVRQHLRDRLLPAVRLKAEPARTDGTGRRSYEADTSGGIPVTRN